MKDVRKSRASRRVLKKLSAVRAVLSNDEREVLDAIVLGEVRAHQMTNDAPEDDQNKSTKTNQRRKGKAAMAMSKKPVNKATSKATAKRQVKAHAMPKTAVNKATSKATSRRQVKAHAMPKTAVNKATSKATS